MKASAFRPRPQHSIPTADCHRCGHRLDATFAGHPEYEDEQPRSSDLAACTYCMAWSQFSSDLQRVPVEPMYPTVFPLRFYLVTEGERVGAPVLNARPDEAVPSSAAVNDVVQLMPEHQYGALLMIVDRLVGTWGVRCYAFVPHPSGGAQQFYLRVAHDQYKRIGACAFCSAD